MASRSTLGERPDFSASASASTVNVSVPKERPKAAATVPQKKAGGIKGGLKGVVLKKKPSAASSKPAPAEAEKEKTKENPTSKETDADSAKKRKTS